MSRPEWLNGTHARYKADTSIFTTWLAENARKTGFTLPSPVNHTTDDLGSEKSNKASPKPTVRQFTVDQLLQHAYHIVSQRPKVPVPESIFITARRAINARSKCAAWFQRAFNGNTNDVLQQQNDGHKHFIASLESMVRVLEPNKTLDAVRDNAPTLPANRYELLEYEDIVEEDVSSASNTMSPDAKNIAPQRTAAAIAQDRKAKARAAAFVLQLQCTLVDFDNIRQHVKQVWTQHKLGKIDLVTASVVTELAFQLIQHSEEQNLCLTMNGEPAVPVTHTQWLWRAYCRACDLPKVYLPDHPLRQLALRMCVPDYQLLETCLNLVIPTDSMLDKLTQDSKYESTVTVVQICWDNVLSGCGDCRKLVSDSVTEQLQSLGKDMGLEIADHLKIRKISIPFGVRMLADIHDVLGPNVDAASKRMKIGLNMSKLVRESYGRFLQTEPVKGLDLDQWTTEDDDELRGLSPLLDDVMDNSRIEREEDGLWSTRPQSNRPSERVTPKFPPYSYNPVICGLTLLWVHLNDLDMATLASDLWWAIIPVAHLYNALKQEGHLMFHWQSMESVITTYTPEHIFHGGKPTNLADCYTKLRLAKGVSATMAVPAAAARTPYVKRTRPKRRLADKIPPFTRMLRHWMMPGGLPGADVVAGTEDPMSKGVLIPLMQKALTSAQKKTDPVSASNNDIPEVSFLKAVQDGIAKEIPGLQIKLWSLNEECIQILIDIHAEFLESFLEAGLRYDPREYPLEHVAEDTIYLAQKRGGADVLPKVAQILKKVLKQK